VSDLTDFRDHARAMATAKHRPECMVRDNPWTKTHPTPGCAGCVTDEDRALWSRLADEATAYLQHDDQETLL